MSSPLPVIERQTIVAPLGVRFRDAVTGAGVSGGLRVMVYPSANPARRVQAHPNPSGVYVLHHAPGLGHLEHGAGDSQFWDTLGPRTSFVCEVVDEERRYQPYTVNLKLPARGLQTWVWPLGEATPASAPPAASFVDDFDDNTRDATLWKVGALTPPPSVFDPAMQVQEQNQQLQITAVTASEQHYSGYVSLSNWNLTDGRATVEVAGVTQGAAQTVFTAALDGSNWFRFLVESGKLNFQTRVGGAETAPDPVDFDLAQMRFWRLRHDRARDQIVFETSGDGAAWMVRRTAPRPFALTGLSLELGAGTHTSVPNPGTAIFNSFVLEANPTPALPLYSAPTRPVPGGMAILRASLWDALADAPASWAILEARGAGQTTVRGMADRDGRIALIFPYPEPTPIADGQPVPPYTKQDWEINLFAAYALSEPARSIPDLSATLAQPRATLWADQARTEPLTKVTLRAGQELLVRSYDTTNGPVNRTPLPVLLITPAA
jgi:hypothetical protein